MVVQKQGIVTILGSNYDVAVTSLRRTLSADMSSKKWLSQNGLCSMKKIASSKELSHSPHSKEVTDVVDSSSSSEGEEDYEEMKQERFQTWNTIQQKENHEVKAGKIDDIWSSILSQKTKEDETSKPTDTPYVHPLVRRSKSCLSEKSLQICTESLGSETGSDGFSTYTPSETYDSEDEKQKQEQVAIHEKEESFEVPKYNSYASKKSLPRCFPPPLTSLSHQHGTPSFHIQSHRDNGRLFLKAVSVPSHNNFCVQRQDGRLVLTFAEQEQQQEELEAEEVESVNPVIMEQAPILPSGMITSVGRLALMMNKPIGLVNINANTNMSSKWSEKFNDVVSVKDVDVVQRGSLPPRPRTRLIPSSHALNGYEYCRRTKPVVKGSFVPSTFTLEQNKYKLSTEDRSNGTSNEGQGLMVLRGKNGDYLVHNLKGCKDSRRSFLFWEPFCIAT
ncbi:hypothetical protein RJT34_28744 [Clitoria ternatea]|uniref:FAF domain-containing protein n=1 Tax=Clitoria ternatea TaxID=43366 RepID=A0AAN9IH48_CLITE